MENAKLLALRTLQSHQAGNTNKYRTARKHNSKQKLFVNSVVWNVYANKRHGRYTTTVSWIHKALWI